MSDDDDLALGSIFPEEARPPTPEPTVTVYEREDGLVDNDWYDIKIRLVGSHPLWGHHLWNAARAFASYLDHNRELYSDGFVLELGAGGGLPGLVAAKNGAKHVVLTDYPDADLVTNMEFNTRENSLRDRVSVQGYVWGHPVQPMLDALPSGADGFQLIIMSDLVFNHSQHDALLKTCERCLSAAEGACVLVFYTHHRPHLSARDMDFFGKAREHGWSCEEVVTRRFAPMFPEDSGSESVRGTVHGWRLVRG
ncbi:nicotinamide N-methyltransferase [Mycena rosella]|uniref:Protein N-terminal and lysine N-methyltransferase EFM7 n=1 Tax=Mycena rosella TaxID=1033263 RepID=A0AAD7D043_MYCRO|nr:nicotinamide N-methyltransferase [Mycena rosella]